MTYYQIETNIEPLKISSEKAKKYLNLRRIKNIEIGLLYTIQKNTKQSLEEIVKMKKYTITNVKKSKKIQTE